MAKDILGRELAVDDLVVYGYTGYSNRARMRVAKINSIIPQESHANWQPDDKIKLEWHDGDDWHFSTISTAELFKISKEDLPDGHIFK